MESARVCHRPNGFHSTQEPDWEANPRLGLASPNGTGCFISLEGGVGSGKSTQLGLLAGWLAGQGVEVCRTREPGGSPWAESARGLLLQGNSSDLSPLTESLLYHALRCDHMEKIVRPALKSGKWVLCDRFQDSTQAVQSAAFGLKQEIVEMLRALILGGFVPDLTFILDVSPQVSLQRLTCASQHRYRRLGKAIHQRVREGFLEIAEKEPQRCVVVNAAADKEIVHRRIVEQIKVRLWPEAQL